MFQTIINIVNFSHNKILHDQKYFFNFNLLLCENVNVSNKPKVTHLSRCSKLSLKYIFKTCNILFTIENDNLSNMIWFLFWIDSSSWIQTQPNRSQIQLGRVNWIQTMHCKTLVQPNPTFESGWCGSVNNINQRAYFYVHGRIIQIGFDGLFIVSFITYAQPDTYQVWVGFVKSIGSRFAISDLIVNPTFEFDGLSLIVQHNVKKKLKIYKFIQ